MSMFSKTVELHARKASHSASFALIKTGSSRRAEKRAFNPDAFTRMQAIRFLVSADHTQLETVERFKKHANSHVLKYVTRRIEALKTAAKRSAAAKKAAETRKAKKAAAA